MLAVPGRYPRGSGSTSILRPISFASRALHMQQHLLVDFAVVQVFAGVYCSSQLYYQYYPWTAQSVFSAYPTTQNLCVLASHRLTLCQNVVLFGAHLCKQYFHQPLVSTHWAMISFACADRHTVTDGGTA